MAYEIDTLYNDSYVDNITLGKIQSMEDTVRYLCNLLIINDL